LIRGRCATRSCSAKSRNFLLEALHPLRKSVAQALDDLKEREIDISQPAPDQILAAILLQHALEITQEFRHAIAPEVVGAPLRRRLLLLIIEPARDRMVGVVNLDDEIGDGELELMRPKPSLFVARRQIQARAEIE
jgi:hypothetical protein